MDTNDFVKGVDFTGFTEANASDLNELVDNATPMGDSATEGKGLVLWTVDSALNTPVVPTTPATTTKWKRYIWTRIPYTGATTKNATLYVWNDDATSDATYLKWLEANAVDIAGLEADIAAAQSDADAALAAANAAAAVAATALSAANNALNVGNNALTVATNALAIAQDPLGQIDDGEIPADLLENTLNFSAKTVILPALSVTAGMLTTILDLSGKTLTLPANIFIASNTGNIAIPALGTAVTANHSLGGVPSYVRWVLVCIGAELGYSAGDEVELNTPGFWTANDEPFGTCWANATQVGLLLNNNIDDSGIQIQIVKRSATIGDMTAITTSNWRLKAYYRL